MSKMIQMSFNEWNLTARIETEVGVTMMIGGGGMTEQKIEPRHVNEKNKMPFIETTKQ